MTASSTIIIIEHIENRIIPKKNEQLVIVITSVMIPAKKKHIQNEFIVNCCHLLHSTTDLSLFFRLGSTMGAMRWLQLVAGWSPLMRSKIRPGPKSLGGSRRNHWVGSTPPHPGFLSTPELLTFLVFLEWKSQTKTFICDKVCLSILFLY